jgi:hypothetical protein
MANGNFGGGSGSSSSPYLIEDAFDLDAIRNKGVSYHYKLTNDIDLNIYPFNSGAGWNPISSFTGDFDGNFKTIRNLFIESNGSQKALFATLNGSAKNLIIENIRINWGRSYNVSYIGALAGQCTSTTGLVENVLVRDMKYYGASYCGGILGRSYGNVKNCVVDDIELYPSGSNYHGGIAGYQYSGDISGCLVDNIRLASGGNTTASYLGGIMCYVNSGTSSNNFFNNSNFNYNVTNGNTSNNMGLNSNEFIRASYYSSVGLGNMLEDLTLTQRGVKAYVIDVNGLTRPKLALETGINQTFLHFNSDYTSLIEFGDVVEGEVSSFRQVTIKVCYDIPINNIRVSWVRRAGVSSLTELEFSSNQSFDSPTSEYILTNQNLQRGDEITFYMRVKTAVGMSGDGAFDLLVDVSS